MSRRQADLIHSAVSKQETEKGVRGMHYGTKPGHIETSKIHFPTSEEVSEVSERAQRRARAKRLVRSKRTSERCERCQRTSEQTSEYLCLDSCLFQTTVRRFLLWLSS